MATLLSDVFTCLQLQTKMENVLEELTEERRRHTETRNQLESTKQQLETAEKVRVDFDTK